MYAERCCWSGSVAMVLANATGMRHGDRGEGAHPVGVRGGQVPGDHGAPVVADHVRAVHAERVEHGERVGDALAHGVVGDGGGARAGGVAALVEGVGADAGVVQAVGDQLPLAGVLGEAVQQQRHRPVRRAARVEVEHQVPRRDLHTGQPKLVV